MISFFLLFSFTLAQECLPACTDGKKCVYKDGTTKTECIIPPSCTPSCTDGKTCSYKPGSTTETECILKPNCTTLCDTERVCRFTSDDKKTSECVYLECRPRCDAGTVCQWKAGATVKTEFECATTQFPTTKPECEKITDAEWIDQPTGKCQCKNATHYYFKPNNHCFPKQICDENSHVPIYDSEQNSCYACTDNKKPKYNKTSKECEPCPTETPVYFYDTLTCIKKEECKTENNQIFVASDNQCVCLGTTEYKNNTCVPACKPACKTGETCQFKKGTKAETECVAPTPVCNPACKTGETCQFKKGSTTETQCVVTTPVCNPACKTGEKCQFKKGSTTETQCVSDGVKGIFFILALVIFFLF